MSDTANFLELPDTGVTNPSPRDGCAFVGGHHGCNGGDFQLWTNTPLNFGDQIRDTATNRCLDSDTSGHVYTLPCNGGAFQQWVVRNTGSFGYEIKNVATGLCLDSNDSGSVYALACNGGNFQRWL